MERFINMNPKPFIITTCPECGEYLAKDGKYKYCMYCGISLIDKELKSETIGNIVSDTVSERGTLIGPRIESI